nr:CRISPR-associated endonuclease Cas2 [Roseburia zhanii]
MKTFYVISYDVVNDRKRRKISKILEGYGKRVQYSVFESILARSDFTKMYHELLAVDIDAETDSIYFYSICSNCEKKKVVIGRKREYLEINDAAVIVL